MPTNSKLSIEEKRRLKNEYERARIARHKAAIPPLSAELLDQLAFEKLQKLASQLERKRETDRRYSREHKEVSLERSRLYREANKEKVQAQLREWQLANPDYNRKYYSENREREQARAREWGRNNPDNVRVYTQNRRSRIIANGGKLSKGIAGKLLKLQKNRCAICKAKFGQRGYQMDHVIALSKGGPHEDSNIQLLCPPCNQSKKDHDPITYMQKRGYLI